MEPVPTITVQQLAALLENPSPNLLVLDVREPAEVAHSALTGPHVIHIPLGQLPTQLATQAHTLPAGAAIAVLCRSGGRSAKATAWLRTQGFQATNVQGGLLAWQQQIDPTLPTP
jgi:rhodanese-related sulfurtransferase